MSARRGPDGPLVLAYHAVSSTWSSPLAMPEDRLRDQLGWLRQRRYVGLTLTDAERRRAEGALPAHCVVVTFDDGYRSTLRALPLLAEAGFPGTVFLVTRFVDSGELLDWPGVAEWLPTPAREELRPLSWSDAEELAAAGWEVGSHTVSHPLLTSLDDRSLADELVGSRTAVARRVGACTALSYPYGVADDRVAASARAVGYSVACTLTFAHVADEPWRRPRIGLSRSDTGLRLAAQLSGTGRRLRRSPAARLGRALHRRRSWLPGPVP